MAFVTLFSCFERFLGFLYRIFLSRKLGAEGLGMYQITLSVVGVLVTLTASGIPITVSRLMLKHRAKGDVVSERQVISAGIMTSLAISLPITIALYALRGKLSFIFADPRCYDVLLVILPSIVLTSVYAVIRGVFWGNKKFFTYSFVELIEEIIMLVFGIALVSKMTSPFDGTIRAGQAIFISYLVSFGIATTMFIIQGGKLGNPTKQLAPLLEASLPIMLMRTSMSLLGTLIAIILPSRLILSGLTSQQALASFGELSGMALPLLFIPSTIIGSIALVLVPELSENFYKKANSQLEEKISNALKCAVFIASFLFPIFIINGEEIGIIIFSNINAGKMLSMASMMIVPMCLTIISTSILNSINYEKKTLLFYFSGAIFLLACTWLLPKFLGIYALLLGYLISYLITATLNLCLLEKVFQRNLIYKKYAFLTILSAISATLFGYFVNNILSIKLNGIWLVMAVSIAIVFFNLIVMKVFDSFKILTYPTKNILPTGENKSIKERKRVINGE